MWLQPWFDAVDYKHSGIRFHRSSMDCSRVDSYFCLHIHSGLAKITFNMLSSTVSCLSCFGSLLHYCPWAHFTRTRSRTEPFVFTDSEDIEEELYSVNSDGTMITHKALWRDTFENHTFEVSKRSQTLLWNGALSN